MLAGAPNIRRFQLILIKPSHYDDDGYVVQWWAFALLTLGGFGYLVYREAHPPSTEDSAVAEATASS